jgi:hypothetical protein
VSNNLHRILLQLTRTKLITDTNDKRKAFKVKLRLWENQLKPRNLFRLPRLKSLDTIFHESVREYSQSIFSLREKSDERFQDFKIMEPEFLLFKLPLDGNIENAPEYL